ncbi:lipid IV(A) 3-deoxy-D-manno-octulosonic acid transferase [Oceanospirillum maris]|uniref:lipid IV(A) 3-deoxy-D-manno-octulosonic acid transferase n=1 Tax=Oceanospirillum maris TaxID=64977 RepID=UPI0003F53FB0|nr:lipid IV(A) 3-deoxy-D-manno-octulosonic acid transferase [Oceanospirillum maris]
MKINRGLYSTILTLLSPVLLWKAQKETTEQNHFSERLGSVPSLPIKPVIWLHAASVGEVVAAAPLIDRLVLHYSQHQLVVTTMTATGARQARKILKGKGVQLMVPVDLPWVANRFLDSLKPDIAIFMETEIWPNLIHGCYEREIPFVIANGRLSEKSHRSYQKFRKVVQEALAGVYAVAAKSKQDAQRFIELGAPSDKVSITGSIKFDINPSPELLEEGMALKSEWFGDRPVWVAGSTHAGEDERLLEAHRLLLEEHSDAVLILVPRHPQRFDAVALLIEDQGFNFKRRSRSENFELSDSVFLADTMGELMLMYAASDIAFVGGSLMPIGGHNLLEPASLGKPVLSGDHLFNFADVAEMFDQHKALIRCADPADIFSQLRPLVELPDLRRDLGEKALAVVESNRGALDKQFAMIERALSSQEAR